ncbi:hypothetical protein N836_21955 [Leptolyngbya sp. Heron Island J]|uniref:DUF4335 domain-containing protein n=1 Tax=Leptolyngbya sp. Heron Island J TaxID=1385935 RepID=UPI0003B95D2C|nr:DUF4335 domain-containing protein [Leptolyngbya sp. Heron Island J]ESA33354.1 hypothetical protein N836_21955 [Leptolyngbya sp. Heron Island J]
MTIQRQYVLPNCSLMLEGLSADTSNVLSILANAEFKFVGIDQSLSGGMEFFNALVGAVSAYCQRLISGLDHPEHVASQSSLVAVEPDEGQYHRLIVKPGILNAPSGESADDTALQTIKLSTVQLFDMAEAIDQFYADAQTLPDVSINLAPLPRKYVRPEEPLTQRALSPLLGLGTLAAAALGLFFLPVPELAEPEGLDPQVTLEEPTGDVPITAPPGDDATAPETADSVPDDSEIEPEAEATTITDAAQLVALQQQVQQQISDALPSDTAFEQSLRYQVAVAENGDIVGYNPSDDAALENIDNTPLPALTYIPVDETVAGAVAQFDVTFLPDGTVEVVADQIVTPEPLAPESEALPDTSGDDDGAEEQSSTQSLSITADSSAEPDNSEVTAVSTSGGQLSNTIATPIRDRDRILALNQQLRRTIIENRDPDRTGPEIRYRIRLDEEGNVTGYEATSPEAERDVNAFNIPELVTAIPDESPQLDFLVVINDDNVVEVNPWDGWP